MKVHQHLSYESAILLGKDGLGLPSAICTTFQGMNMVSPVLYTPLSKGHTWSPQYYTYHSSSDGHGLPRTTISLSKGCIKYLPDTITTPSNHHSGLSCQKKKNDHDDHSSVEGSSAPWKCWENNGLPLSKEPIITQNFLSIGLPYLGSIQQLRNFYK